MKGLQSLMLVIALLVISSQSMAQISFPKSLQTTPFDVEAASTSITNMKGVNVIGRSTNVDSAVDTDIWDLTTQAIWLAPTEARLHTVESTDAGDNSGTGTLTLTGAPLNTETVTIGAKTYTFQQILTDVDGNVLIEPDATATGTLTMTDVPLDTETVTINGKVYTFQATLTDVDGNVKIKGDASGSGTLTLTDVPVNAETVTIGAKVYTWQSVLTDVDGNVFIEPDATATGTLTLTALPLDSETVTIGSKVYTFQATLTDVDGHVHLGASQSETVDNLVAAITGAAGAGTKYAASTVTNTQVTGVNNAGNMDVTAILAGTAANSIATTETMSNGAWGAGTLTGGTDDASASVDNIVAAITGAAGAGTKYAASMVTNTDVTGVNTAGNLVLTAINAGTAANAVATTETMTNASFGNATLTGGTDDASGSIDNLIAALDLSGVAGTDYAASMVAGGVVTGVNNAGNMVLTPNLAGTVGNYTTTETLTNGSFGAATLTGGTDDTTVSIDNLIAAINLGAGAGSKYAAATAAPASSMLAVDGAGDTMVLFDNDSLDLATTETLTNGSWGAATATALGGKKVRVYGLKTWSSKETSEDIALHGVTPITTVNSYVIINKLEMLLYGSSGPNIGVITATAATDTTISAQINALNGVSKMAILGIPSTQSAYIFNYYSNVIKPATSLTFESTLLVNLTPTSQLTKYIERHSIGVAVEGGSYVKNSFNPALRIDGPAVIKIQSNASANDTDVVAGFGAVLIDK